MLKFSQTQDINKYSALKNNFLMNIALKKMMLVSAQCLLGSLARQYCNYALHSLHVLHQLRAQPVSCWSHRFVIKVAGVPFALYYLLQHGSHPERRSEQRSRKECFLTNSASVISINIKLIKTLVINILAFVLVYLIYLNVFLLCLFLLPKKS